jgi:hypothetical protein
MNIEENKNGIDIDEEIDVRDENLPPIDMDDSMTDLNALPDL